jgi:hypothetical protein
MQQPNQKKLEKSNVKKQTSISIRTSYNKASKEKEELFSARVTGNVDGLSHTELQDRTEVLIVD